MIYLDPSEDVAMNYKSSVLSLEVLSETKY